MAQDRPPLVAATDGEGESVSVEPVVDVGADDDVCGYVVGTRVHRAPSVCHARRRNDHSGYGEPRPLPIQPCPDGALAARRRSGPRESSPSPAPRRWRPGETEQRPSSAAMMAFVVQKDLVTSGRIDPKMGAVSAPTWPSARAAARTADRGGGEHGSWSSTRFARS